MFSPFHDHQFPFINYWLFALSGNGLYLVLAKETEFQPSNPLAFSASSHPMVSDHCPLMLSIMSIVAKRRRRRRRSNNRGIKHTSYYCLLTSKAFITCISQRHPSQRQSLISQILKDHILYQLHILMVITQYLFH